MIKGVVAGDFHLGLVTDELDRTDEIISVMRYIFEYAVKAKCKFIILNGDTFHTNNPNDHLIGLFISVLNIIKNKNIRVYILVGNHEAITRHKRKSCLSFVNELKGGYENVELIDDIKTMRMWKSKSNDGDIYFTFMPHVCKAHIDTEKYKNVQDYLDVKAQLIQDKLPMYSRHFVFSHLLVKGIIPGSEDSMLKRSNIYIPKVFMQKNKYGLKSIVLNNHIHSRGRVKNVRLVGSPIFCRFDEKDEAKYFVELSIPTVPFNNPKVLKYKKTPCHKFQEYSINLIEEDLASALKSIKPDKNSIVKINATCSEKDDVNWEEARKKIEKRCFYIKPIQPRVVRRSVKRDEKQVADLKPEKAVKLWLKRNKVGNRKEILILANRYIEEVL